MTPIRDRAARLAAIADRAIVAPWGLATDAEAQIPMPSARPLARQIPRPAPRPKGIKVNIPQGGKALRRLAELLASYEADAPHWDEATGAYPAFSWGDIARDLASPHTGDCTGEAHSCLRCRAEEVRYKAVWLTERMGLL